MCGTGINGPIVGKETRTMVGLLGISNSLLTSSPKTVIGPSLPFCPFQVHRTPTGKQGDVVGSAEEPRHRENSQTISFARFTAMQQGLVVLASCLHQPLINLEGPFRFCGNHYHPPNHCSWNRLEHVLIASSKRIMEWEGTVDGRNHENHFEQM